MVVTESLENYLRVIYEVQLEKDIARIKDIIKKLSVKTSSAVEAVKKLSSKGLVVYEKHGYIKLTQNGIIEAQKIYQKYKILFRFLREFLGLKEDEAERLACGIEHHITDNLYEKLETLVVCLQHDENLASALRKVLEEGCEMNLTLNEIKMGERVRVVRISGDPRIKSRLLSMGVIPGIELTVERIAPLGDPMEIRYKNLRLSLRKEEAKAIFVEKE